MRTVGAAGLYMGMLLNVSAAQSRPDQAPAAPQEKRVDLSQALNSTVANSPVIRSQLLAEAQANSAKIAARGPFDTATNLFFSQNNIAEPLTPEQINENYPYTTPVLKTHISSFQASANKQFVNGLSSQASLYNSRVTDNETQLNGVSSTTLNLGVTIPLLKGRGRSVTALARDTTALEALAVHVGNGQIIAQSLVMTAQTYWSLVAAQDLTSIANEAEARGEEYVADVKAYIAADHVPANDLNQVIANLAQRSSDREDQKQNLVQQRELLRLQACIGTDSDEEALAAVDRLPTFEEAKLDPPAPGTLERLVSYALQHEPEYEAAEDRVKEAQRTIQADRSRLRPQLDLHAQAGYTGLTTGRDALSLFSSAVVGIPGPAEFGSITYSYQIGNHAAEGALQQAVLTLRQNEFTRDHIRDQIQTNVVRAFSLVQTSGRQVKYAHDEVEALQRALTGEQVKYRSGLSSITDLLILEDRVTSADIQEVQAKLAFVNAVTGLNLALGKIAVLVNSPHTTIPTGLFLPPISLP